MMYEAVIPIRVTLADPAIALGDAIDQVTDELAVIDEQTPQLLDYAVSSDATNDTAVFEVTVDAADEIEALAGAVSWVRAAIHATGGATPGWSVGSVGSVSVQPLAISC
jgi:HAMP domain-containing protein